VSVTMCGHGLSKSPMTVYVHNDVKAMHDRGVKAENLKQWFTLEQLKKGEYTAAECRKAKFTLDQLKAAKFTAKNCKDAKFTLDELKTAKFTLVELKAAKFTAAELTAAKFTAAELKAAKFTLAELKAAKFTAIECLLAPGVSRPDLERAGFNMDLLKKQLDKALFDKWRDPTEVERLVKLGANGSGYKDSYGITALIRAANHNKPKCVKLMLSTMSKDEAAVAMNDGETALSYAVRYGHADCVELLLQHLDRQGVTMKSYHGKTAKEWAQKKNHTPVLALFTKYGY